MRFQVECFYGEGKENDVEAAKRSLGDTHPTSRSSSHGEWG